MSASGKSTVSVLIEGAVPAVFSLDGSGTGPAVAIRTGGFESLYLTGLGSNEQAPTVLVDGINATVTYAGQAPGFPGLDQVNIQIPSGARTGTPVPLVIQVGKHARNTTTLTF
jgi:uncharacterized protein (TIGR03437 family)